ncbi:hypothetical protein Ancab_036940 [Ancistrocladus abbreviatus]
MDNVFFVTKINVLVIRLLDIIDSPDALEYGIVIVDKLPQLEGKRQSQGQSPNWIITEFAAPWTVDIAQECSVYLMHFSMFSVGTYCFLGPPEYVAGEGQKRVRATPESLKVSPQWITFESSLAFPGYEAAGVLAGFYGEYVDLLRTLSNKPLIPAGLLPPELEDNIGSIEGSWGEVFKWLDEQEPKTVIFVGFGSECKLTKDQVQEIPYGLELSQLPFLWALRILDWAMNDTDALPSGFRDRTHGKGRGSIIEALQYGHVLVVLPFIIDQSLNATLAVDKGLAIEVERMEDGSFSRDDIAKALIRAMVEEEGEKTRVCAGEAAAVFADRELHQDHYIGGLVEYLRNGTRKQRM